MGYAAVALRERANTRYSTDFEVRRDRDETDIDGIEDLGDEIATLSAHIHAATHRLLVMIAEFDRRRGWELSGYQNCARWLAARTGIDLGAAREKVRAARALEELPLTSAAMSRGELSFSQVRALSRAATADTEAELLELARGTTTAQLERMVRAWKKGCGEDEATRERERHESRTLSVFPDDDGMYVVRGLLTPEVGALLMRAIEAASDALYRAGGAAKAAGAPESAHETATVVTLDSDREAAQRRADAMALLAERALAAGFGGTESTDGTPEPPISGTRAERYLVMLHVEPATLIRSPALAHGAACSRPAAEPGTLPDAGGLSERAALSEPCDPLREIEPGRSELEDGTRVSAETSRRLSCDASVVRVTHNGDSSVLDVGRKTRTIPPALRRALEVRDCGCRFPGCHLRFTDAHHVKHWADGGETGLSNCLLLCGWHHRLVHEAGWRVEWWGKRPVFRDPRGHEHFDGRWNPPELPRNPAAALVGENERRGIMPDAWTAGARWEREADIPPPVSFRALEVL
jgi:hypothetical protein